MITSALILMGLVVFAAVLQSNYKIPSPVTLMVVVLCALYFDYRLFKLTSKQFDDLVVFTLPLLIASDALKMSWSDLKRHGISFFWVAVVSVLCAIFAGTMINDYVLIDYPLSIAAVVILFCMLSATDPITVSAIFSNFKVPHKLKVLTEGESLFNDATALIVFSVALVALDSPQKVGVGFVALKSVSVIGGAIVVGVVLGYLTTVALKLSENAFIEATILLMSSYLAYVVAEHYHFSGILAVIFDMVIANRVIQEFIEKENREIDDANKNKNFGLLKNALTTKDNHEVILKSIDFVCLFASSMLFVSIAAVANLDKLFHYKYEIFAVFIATTAIRALMMLKFAMVSNKVSFMQSIQKHWWAVLTFAGSKGALSILMVHMIPSTFKYKDLFETVVIGNIFLSTFVYSAILGFIFVKNKSRFEQECGEDVH